jgi:hypothetical protein
MLLELVGEAVVTVPLGAKVVVIDAVVGLGPSVTQPTAVTMA